MDNKDIFGQAILDFYTHNHSDDIVVQASDFDDDTIPVSYLFRTYSEMPEIEQKALDLSYGNVLDVGCGAGSHSLFLQNKTQLSVRAIDISKEAISVCTQRGVENASHQNLFDHTEEKYDTLLFLMNGSGIIGKLDRIHIFLTHCTSLLNPKGQILIDSSDISYLFQEEDGGFWVNTAATYYGEMRYKIKYKNNESDWFDWLYIDYGTLEQAAHGCGFLCELVLEGENQDYLARLTLATDIP